MSTKKEVEEQFKQIFKELNLAKRITEQIDPYTRCMQLPYDEIHSAVAPWHGLLMEQYKTKEDLCRHVVADLESYTEEVDLMEQEIAILKEIQKRRALNEEEQEAIDFMEGHMEYATSLLSAIKGLLT